MSEITRSEPPEPILPTDEEPPEENKFVGFEVGMTVEITQSQRDYFGNPGDLIYKKGTRGVVEKVTVHAVYVRTDTGQLILVHNPNHLSKTAG